MTTTKISKTFQCPITKVVFKAELYRTDKGEYIWLVDPHYKIKSTPEQWIKISET
jgi:hypothetical protein